MRSTRLLAALFACALVGLPLASCSGMGEGERCDYNEDCGSNLECIPRGDLRWPSGGQTDVGICCPVGGPVARQSSRAEVCRSATSVPIPDAGTDTGVDATPGVDSGSDAEGGSGDGAADANGDAPADAADEG